MHDTEIPLYSKTLSPAKTTAPFRLIRYFTLVSLVSIVVTSLLLDSWVRQISVNNLIQNEQRNNIALTQILANAVWPRFHQFITNANQLTANEIREHPTTQDLEQFLHQQVRDLNVIKIKIYDLDGLTVFSSDFKQIGDSQKLQASFIKARHGQVVSNLSFRDSIYAKKSFIQNRNIIASYVPVRLATINDIVAVFEVYKDVTPTIINIDATQTKVIIGVVGTLGILFIVLYFLVRRADNIIQEQHRAQHEVTEKIRHVAFYDSLTGLPNRILFLERLDHAINIASRSNKLLALMFIDLDRFKQVNDNLGHDAGDLLLRQVADRFSRCIRSGDTIARISGDEFTIILENLKNIELATTIAQRVINEISQPFQLGNNEAFVTCSIGLSIYPFDDNGVESLMKKADAAMYFSKSYGRNNYHYFTPDMLQHGSPRYDLEKDLTIAIMQSQFYIYFQPKVDLSDWKMHGMEALIRWKHPSKGTISPNKFVPILEETGMIIQVGEWMLRESCRITKQWQNENLAPLCVAVNVSALQFRQPGFVDMVYSALNDSGLDAHCLELELTESCLIEDLDDNINIMQALKNKGIKLTIDDFGTAYSSLSYLCKLPIDTLKIDRSFIRNLLENNESRSIVTAIISFAHGLKIDVVAEGIETQQQLTFVSAMRCTAVQGYLLSKPISVNEFYTLYKKNGSFEQIAGIK